MPASASSRGHIAAWLPLELGSPRVRFHVSETHFLWQPAGQPATVVSWGDLASIRLEARLSWGQAVVWYLLLPFMWFGGSWGWFVIGFVLISFGAIANLFLRRRYVLTVTPRVGPDVELYLGAGYPPGALTLAPSSWVGILEQGYAWLRADAHRHGIDAS